MDSEELMDENLLTSSNSEKKIIDEENEESPLVTEKLECDSDSSLREAQVGLSSEPKSPVTKEFPESGILDVKKEEPLSGVDSPVREESEEDVIEVQKEVPLSESKSPDREESEKDVIEVQEEQPLSEPKSPDRKESEKNVIEVHEERPLSEPKSPVREDLENYDIEVQKEEPPGAPKSPVREDLEKDVNEVKREESLRDLETDVHELKKEEPLSEPKSPASEESDKEIIEVQKEKPPIEPKSPVGEDLETDVHEVKKEEPFSEPKSPVTEDLETDVHEVKKEEPFSEPKAPVTEDLEKDVHEVRKEEPLVETESQNNRKGGHNLNEKSLDDTSTHNEELGSERLEETNQADGEVRGEENGAEFDGTKVPGMEANISTPTREMDLDAGRQRYAWPEKASVLTCAVRSLFRRLSGKKNEGMDSPADNQVEDDMSGSNVKVVSDSDVNNESEEKDISHKTADQSSWNPLNYIWTSRDANAENKEEQKEEATTVDTTQPIVTKGRVILYTRLGCQDCKQARLFLHSKRLRYVEINIDVYPSRKMELEKIAGSSAVPKVFFNDILIGGLTELRAMNETGEIEDKIDYLTREAPSLSAPMPPLSGEDDASSSGSMDELALIVLKMKNSVAIKDRFYKVRRFTNCFLGSEAVDFLSEDQFLERTEATEFGRKLASKLFFKHVLDENVFEDGNHFYRFLDHDPIVSSQCFNIPRGIIDVKPRPIMEIASRLRFLSYAIFEAYTSEDGKHVDYRSIHGSEEFARYLRTVEELQRVELVDMPREEKLAFFINLFNMMAIHAILVLGHPAGALERKKLLGDFNYIIGGCTYSLSAIRDGILRGNQRQPYNLTKPFGANDARSKIAFPYTEPLIHFALVSGHQSGPALRCYSPGNIDKELTEAARNFLRNGGLVIDSNAKVASSSKILKWYSIDFGKNETEVLKHAANYLEPSDSEMLLDLLSNTQLKVIYQTYDWGLNR
ncbi:DEP domain [Dillenia turbinata]|uniref:DEP domain n=1 Tax=Dillenia turbinata TaxID=194707 RepID=A0AAN8ZMX3_9MAGN